ncbi:hypothetical protein MMC26_003439 [Xylographa opegraphella]|nr:hypothetical protein [Xylographa opegraphella]
MDPMMVKEQAQDEQYGHHQWVDINDYHSPHVQSPANEYNGFGYMANSHALPMESSYGRSIQSSYSMHQSQQSMMPTQWPSMLTNPSSNASSPAPIQVPPPLAPISTFATVHSLPPLTTPVPTASARRTLTDQDRRRMCLYHEENPTVKQTEIGAMFGVERSTVSKVLRQKEKYLFPDDGSRSPVKRSKGKFPDIERALSNWARNHQRQGLPLSDSMIRDKARFFATTVGNSDSHVKVNSNNWLEKFKQKNHLLGAKPRKASDANDSDNGYNVDSVSGSQTPSNISPVSPIGVSSPSPLSASRGRESIKTESPDSYMDFSASYRHTHSQSATSLASCFSDNTAPSSFSGGPQSPIEPFFSSDPNSAGPYLPSQNARFMTLASSNTARPRSQTFPMLGIETTYAEPPGPGEYTPKQMQQIMAAPTLETPIEDLSDSPLAIVGISQHHRSHPANDIHSPKQNSSPTLMAPPPHPNTSSSTPNTSNVSSPISPPSQDEARRALELVLNFFQNQPTGVVDPQEFVAMGKLMEKLKFQGVGDLPGGMHSIVVGEQEMSRKRSIHSL